MMLEVNQVSSYYGKIQALHEVSLTVAAGEIVALIGANGAGKTTLLNTICGLMKPQSGTVVFNGQNITGLSAMDVVRRGMAHVPEHRLLFDTMTVYDNLLIGAYHRYGQAGKAQVEADLAAVYATFPILKERSEQLAGTLSGGEQQMLAVGRGLMSNPSLILFDEPSLGLAPLIVEDLMNVIRRLRDENKTVLVVEQNARAALRLSDRAYVLENGKVVLEGESDKLTEDERIQRVYMGMQKV